MEEHSSGRGCLRKFLEDIQGECEPRMEVKGCQAPPREELLARLYSNEIPEVISP